MCSYNPLIREYRHCILIFFVCSWYVNIVGIFKRVAVVARVAQSVKLGMRETFDSFRPHYYNKYDERRIRRRKIKTADAG